MLFQLMFKDFSDLFLLNTSKREMRFSELRRFQEISSSTKHRDFYKYSMMFLRVNVSIPTFTSVNFLKLESYKLLHNF